MELIMSLWVAEFISFWRDKDGIIDTTVSDQEKLYLEEISI
jgi:hypothetical protein